MPQVAGFFFQAKLIDMVVANRLGAVYAVIVTWARDIRDHKWLAVRAILVGWAALIGLWLVTVRLVNLDEWLLARGVVDIRSFWPDPRRPFFHFLIGGVVNAAAAWIVGRFHRAYWAPMVLVFFASLLIYDLTRFTPAAAWGSGRGRFWGIITLDFIFMRLPMVAVALWGAWRLRRAPVVEAPPLPR